MLPLRSKRILLVISYNLILLHSYHLIMYASTLVSAYSLWPSCSKSLSYSPPSFSFHLQFHSFLPPYFHVQVASWKITLCRCFILLFPLVSLVYTTCNQRWRGSEVNILIGNWTQHIFHSFQTTIVSFLPYTSPTTVQLIDHDP